ncbi:hypothetical protein KFL_000730220 [Klebsormidium nitens]|uniref:TF-B3 domain-containing protein n=1 Tax=Klebsormidium nitens TaxID=105231 RepID=A0A1Y1HRB4_KLENI|nr:hypothetical protein KFL_000730220 [Klebsormidium nitens]|eukprot:GAQ81185.1 hypothetical protein KFL_000730220 [Klebsormidium nitens]
MTNSSDRMLTFEQDAPTALHNSEPESAAASSRPMRPEAFEPARSQGPVDTDADSRSSSCRHAAETGPPEVESASRAGNVNSQGLVGTGVAEQLDQLGDAMLAEVEAALAAEARGDGFYGANKLGVNEFGVHEPRKLSRLASLDVLSEILSWEAFGGSEKHEERGVVDSKVGVVDSRPRGGGVESDVDNNEDDAVLASEKGGGDRQGGKDGVRGDESHQVNRGDVTKVPASVESGGGILKSKSIESEWGIALVKCGENAGGGTEDASSEGAVQELLKSYDRALDIKEKEERGGGAPSTEPSSGLSQLGEMEVDQELMTALKSNVQLRDEHGTLERAGSGEGSGEQTGGWFGRAPEVSQVGAFHDLVSRGGPVERAKEIAERVHKAGGAAEADARGLRLSDETVSALREQLLDGLDHPQFRTRGEVHLPHLPPRARPADPLHVESQSSTLTYTGSGNRVSGNRLQSRRPHSTPTSPVLSPLPSPKMTLRSQSFKESVQVGGYSRVPVDVPKPQPAGENQRMRFSPQQQKTLQEFGTKVNWVGPGVESMEEAHQICAEMSMDIKQLKKWISNHRPKELRSSSTPRPGVQPPWAIVPPLANSAFPGVYSEAALRGLSAAHPALVGHPFYPPAPFFGGPQFPQGAWVPPHYAPGGQAMWPWPASGASLPPQASTPGGAVPPPQQRSDAPGEGGGKPVDVKEIGPGGAELVRGGSLEANGGKQVPLDMERLANADNLRQVLGRKLKDFDPGKIQKLVEICKTYRQKQSSDSPHERHDGPPKKKQLKSPPEVENQLPFPPPLNLDSATPQDEYQPQWGDTLLAESTPFGGRSDNLVADPTGWNMGDLANAPFANAPFENATTLQGDGRAKAEKGLPKPGLAYPNPSMHGELAQAFDQNFLGGQPRDEMSLLPFPPPSNQFLAHSAAGGPGQQTWPEPGFDAGLANGFFYNPAAHPAAFGAFSPLEMGLPAGGVPRPATSSGKPPRTVRALHMRGGCTAPFPGTDPKEWRVNEAPGLWVRGPVTPQPMRGKFLFEKVLTASDTSPLGRIILPKSQAELHLPKVLDKEGGLITVEDADRNRWQLRYRFWPNNKSRIYVFEHTADFVQSRGLRPGDYLVVCRADEGHLILNDRRRPESPEGDPSERRATSEGSRSTRACRKRGADVSSRADVIPGGAPATAASAGGAAAKHGRSHTVGDERRRPRDDGLCQSRPRRGAARPGADPGIAVPSQLGRTSTVRVITHGVSSKPRFRPCGFEGVILEMPRRPKFPSLVRPICRSCMEPGPV